MDGDEPRAADGAPSAALPIPLTLDAIADDPRWLERAPGLDVGAIRAVRQAPGAGGIAVTSRVARLVLELAPGPEGRSRSVFAKVRNPAWRYGPALHEREVRFYRELAPGHPELPAPRCYY